MVLTAMFCVQYGKHNLPFVLPGLHWPEIILPPSNVTWIISQPENILSDDKVQDELLGLQYFAHGPTGAAVHDFTVIRRNLTQQMHKILPDMVDEMRAAFDDYLPSTTDNDEEGWAEVEGIRVIVKTTQRTIERMFVGLPLCRDMAYLKAIRRWSVVFALSGSLFRFFWPTELLAPMLNVLVAAMKWMAVRKSLPLIRQRIRALKAREAVEKNEETGVEMPSDMLQWIIELNAQKPDPMKLSAWDIAGKLVLFELFGNPTFSLFTTHARPQVRSISLTCTS